MGKDIFAAPGGLSSSSYFGYSVSLSGSGDMVAVGSPNHGAELHSSGRAITFKWNGSIWTPIGQDLDGSKAFQQFGWSVALSSDGNIVALGEPSNRDSPGHVRAFQIPIAATSVGSQGDAHCKQTSSLFFIHVPLCLLINEYFIYR